MNGRKFSRDENFKTFKSSRNIRLDSSRYCYRALPHYILSITCQFPAIVVYDSGRDLTWRVRQVFSSSSGWSVGFLLSHKAEKRPNDS